MNQTDLDKLDTIVEQLLAGLESGALSQDQVADFARQIQQAISMIQRKLSENNSQCQPYT